MGTDIAIITYHKNAKINYPIAWINQFRDSILNQTYKDFHILELDYGGTGYKIFPNSEYYTVSVEENFVYAMMKLIDHAKAKGYKYLFNTNVDDYYSEDRIEKQIKGLNQGYDVVSSNFSLINNKGQEFHRHKFHHLDISKELSTNHNIIAHPVLGFNLSYFDDFNYDPTEIPIEDLLLWKRSINHKKFIILEDNLLYHRVHNNSVSSPSNSNNR